MSAMKLQCNGMSKEKYYVRVSAAVLCLFFAPLTRPKQRIGRPACGKRGETQEIRKKVKKKECNGMEGGQTCLMGLCCVFSPSRGSLDASPSVELTANALRDGEQAWGGNKGW